MTLLKSLKTAFEHRPDTEHKQAILRVIIVFLALVWMCVARVYHPTGFTDEVSKIMLQCACFSMVFAIGIVFHIAYRKPLINYSRRIIGMAHDVFLVSTLFYYAGESAAMWIWVYPFTAIGNGFRFGEKWLLGSAAMGVIALTFLFTNSNFWSSIPLVAIGLVVNFITIAIYTCFLLKRLRTTTAKLERMATHDSLTGLPNRVLLLERLGVALKSNRLAGRMIACIYFDLDGFKLVNDRLGHAAGDQLLQEVGRRTQEVIRDTDLLARLGGDEFAVIMGAIEKRDDVEIICARIVKAIKTIRDINGQPIEVSVSVGCVIVSKDVPETGLTQESVVRFADDCMYLSKKAGSGRFTIAEFN